MTPEEIPVSEIGPDYTFRIPVEPTPPAAGILVEESRLATAKASPLPRVEAPRVEAPIAPPPPPRVEATPEVEVEVEASANGAEPDNDYFELSTPIYVDGKEFKRLRINPKGILKGKQFFALIGRYQRKFPDEARTAFNKFTSENFLSLVLAEINRIAPEDLYKVDYLDLPLLFLQASAFHFAGGKRATAPAKEEESPKTMTP
jgi:hypothetical protein